MTLIALRCITRSSGFSFAFVSDEIPNDKFLYLGLYLPAARYAAVWLVGHQLTRNCMIWRSVPSVLRCSPTLEICRVPTRSVSSVCWTTARTDNLETACLVHCAGKSSLFQITGYQGRRRTISWRNCFMPESFQPDRKHSRFHVMYAAVMRQVLVKLWNLLQCIVSSVNRTTANSVVYVIGRSKAVPATLRLT